MTQLPFFPLLPPKSWSVTDLTRYLRELLEDDEVLQDVWVQGEVSNLSRPSSGHLYFTLKDSSAALRCVMWRNNAMRLKSLPHDGDAIEAHGAISVYETGGQYQLYADVLRPAGEGALYQEFLRLKARLEAEGLFDPQRKRELPRWPERIGIVTSPTGAALRDILNTLRRRYPLAQVILSATPVQGDEAPPGIVTALHELNRLTHPDVILLARGGGSIEDLWAFNDERVAYAIAASPVPVITGVGHETDYTIADFVADLRAPTPTAAAELATPNQADLLLVLDDFVERMGRASQSAIDIQRWALAALRSRLSLKSPLLQLQADRQRLDELSYRSSSSLMHRLQIDLTRLSGLGQRLNALSPQSVLERGYAILTDSSGRVIYNTSQVSLGDHLNAHLSDGDFGVSVETPSLPLSIQNNRSEQ